MDSNPNDAYIIGGLLLNAVVTILAVMRSKLILEHRMTKVETLVSVLINNSGAHVRNEDLSPRDRGCQNDISS